MCLYTEEELLVEEEEVEEEDEEEEEVEGDGEEGAGGEGEEEEEEEEEEAPGGKTEVSEKPAVQSPPAPVLDQPTTETK